MSDFVFKSVPMGFERLDKFPFDKTSVWDTLAEAQAYASSPTACDLQLIGVNNGGKPQAYIVYSGQLYPVGGGTQTKVIASESEMLALTDIEIGTMVFRTDIGKYFILVNSDTSQIDSWMTETKESLQWGSF